MVSCIANSAEDATAESYIDIGVAGHGEVLFIGATIGDMVGVTTGVT